MLRHCLHLDVQKVVPQDMSSSWEREHQFAVTTVLYVWKEHSLCKKVGGSVKKRNSRCNQNSLLLFWETLLTGVFFHTSRPNSSTFLHSVIKQVKMKFLKGSTNFSSIGNNHQMIVGDCVAIKMNNVAEVSWILIFVTDFRKEGKSCESSWCYWSSAFKKVVLHLSQYPASPHYFQKHFMYCSINRSELHLSWSHSCKNRYMLANVFQMQHIAAGVQMTSIQIKSEISVSPKL